MDERPVSLSRDRALAAGIALADEDGLGAVSMRTLAGRLGVSPMALYKHVSGKDDLIDGMIDRVVAAYDVPETTGGWRPAVRARILSARRTLDAHPWLRQAIELRGTRTPGVLAHMDSIAGLLIAGGFTVDLTHHAMHALGHRIWGFSPEAFVASAPRPALPADQQEAMLRAMTETYPNIAAIAADAAARGPVGACDDDYEFEFTLDLLLDAFERLHDAGWESRHDR